ncbi:MAG TPA: YihY/virulence factor BrkB family protein [candidate division Zixibacteria bacterium]
MLKRFARLDIGLWDRARTSGGMGPRVLCGVSTVVRGVFVDAIWVKCGYYAYLTLLDMLPLGAVALALTSRLGWQQYLVDWLSRHLSPTAPRLAGRLIRAIAEVDLTALGYIGIAGSILAGVLIMVRLELDFDAIWVVRRRRKFPLGAGQWLRPALAYPLILLIAPSVIAVALLSGALAEANSRALISTLPLWGEWGRWLQPILGELPSLFGLIPSLVTWGLFAVFYYAMPTGPVQKSAALIGGAAAALMWRLTLELYLNFQFAADTFRAAWGFLAQIPLLLFWLYLSWTIFFIGAQIAFAWQRRGAYMPKHSIAGLSPASIERSAIAVRQAFVTRKADDGVTTAQLSWDLGLPWQLVERITEFLYVVGVVSRDNRHVPSRYAPTEKLEQPSEDDLLRQWRDHGGHVP